MHVFLATRPVLMIAHDDGDWSFMCGDADHGNEDWRVVGVGHLIDRDPTLNECADLPDNFEAERASVGKPWVKTSINAKSS